MSCTFLRILRVVYYEKSMKIRDIRLGGVLLRVKIDVDQICYLLPLIVSFLNTLAKQLQHIYEIFKFFGFADTEKSDGHNRAHVCVLLFTCSRAKLLSVTSFKNAASSYGSFAVGGELGCCAKL